MADDRYIPALRFRALTRVYERAQPAAEVIGLDGDPDVLERARVKARSAGVEVQFGTLAMYRAQRASTEG